MHTVYILENQDDKSWYIGQTDDLKRRLIQHNSGNGGRTTRIKTGPWKLMYAEAYCDKRDALGRERFLKGGAGRRFLKKQLANYLRHVRCSKSIGYNEIMEKHKARLAAFAILERDGKILLARRFDTGYADGQYQMPSGHIEANEYPVEAAIREAKEEVGVDIDINDLEFVHASYRINQTDSAGDYVDFFFKAAKWSGEPINAEPEKCDEIIWVPITELPANTVPVIREVIEYIIKGIPFSQIGRKQ